MPKAIWKNKIIFGKKHKIRCNQKIVFFSAFHSFTFLITHWLKKNRFSLTKKSFTNVQSKCLSARFETKYFARTKVLVLRLCIYQTITERLRFTHTILYVIHAQRTKTNWLHCATKFVSFLYNISALLFFNAASICNTQQQQQPHPLYSIAQHTHDIHRHRV